jgi:RNA polymerase sigma-70 factor (ECF subfamily)
MNDPTTDPSALMGKALDGDQEAYRAFLKWASEFTTMIAKKRFYRWSLNSNEMVFDFVQEVLLAVHQKRHTYLRHLPVEPWLAGIVKFKSIDWLRSGS